MSDFFKRIYSEIARNYEKVNHIFTFGLDIYWRRRLAKMVARDGGASTLDVCTGTGELARDIKKLSTHPIKITGTDFSNEMLDEARKHPDKTIEYIYADTSALPFPDNSFDVATMSFAARNLNSGELPLSAYFKEICRVLKEGGVFYNLETSQPSNKLVRAGFKFYIKMLGVIFGKRCAGSEDGYKYLVRSIIEFMGPDELAQKLKRAGFKHVEYFSFFSGSVVVHKALK